MRISFTKMQGAGNDFVVLDETAGQFGLSSAHYRLLADRHFGVGADQILTVRPSPAAGIDFQYIIHNADGAEVEQCGNGARCFARFVRDRGLCNKDTIRVQTLAGVIEPRLLPDGRVVVNLGEPVFELSAVPFDGGAVQALVYGAWQLWPLELAPGVPSSTVLAAVLSMGNPHAVLLVDDVDAAPVLAQGPLVQKHPAFVRGVNVGFMQIVDRGQIRLRVFERGAGETLACGSGACAAVVAGIRLGLLDGTVEVQARGGKLGMCWDGPGTSVLMTGQAATVFHGEIDLPDHL
ncbi:MAG: diaminopimelate epimerase [Burkholderiales bacterium]|nr:diaminopimelate epimerase [Burkholderiales bacterium]